MIIIILYIAHAAAESASYEVSSCKKPVALSSISFKRDRIFSTAAWSEKFCANCMRVAIIGPTIFILRTATLSLSSEAFTRLI